MGFLDILGFREIVKNLLTDSRLKEVIGHFLIETSGTSDLNRELPEDDQGGFGFSMFSDSIVVSKPIDKSGWAEWLVCFELGSIAADLLQKGILSRGGVACGLFHHKDGVLIGEGLIRAYEIENKVAHYPRIVVEDDVYATVVNSKVKGIVYKTKDNLFFRDTDGFWVIEPFFEEWFPTDKALQQCKVGIENKLSATLSTDRPELGQLAKQRWIANQFNRALNIRKVDISPIIVV